MTNPRTGHSFVSGRVQKNNNSYLNDKVALRIEACSLVKKKSIEVLDCFHGSGLIWKLVKDRTNKDINVTGIDKSDVGIFSEYVCDNVQFLKSCDLSTFDVIDLDSYGVPFEQFGILRRRGILES